MYRRVAPARVNHMQAVAFLFSHVSETQFFRIEEFNNPSFQRHAYNSVMMPNEMLSPLSGSALRVETKEQLDDFLARPDAAQTVKAASFEEIFFTVKGVGLADSLDLLPLVSGKQVRGFIDLDCWRKDTFVRKPFMEWMGAFIQAGSEETMKAISGVDDTVISLFLKDLTHVYEVDRDDPPTGTQLIFTPDNRFAVEPLEQGEATTIGMLILDALFKYNPNLRNQIWRKSATRHASNWKRRHTTTRTGGLKHTVLSITTMRFPSMRPGRWVRAISPPIVNGRSRKFRARKIRATCRPFSQIRCSAALF